MRLFAPATWGGRKKSSMKQTTIGLGLLVSALQVSSALALDTEKYGEVYLERCHTLVTAHMTADGHVEVLDQVVTGARKTKIYELTLWDPRAIREPGPRDKDVRSMVVRIYEPGNADDKCHDQQLE